MTGRGGRWLRNHLSGLAWFTHLSVFPVYPVLTVLFLLPVFSAFSVPLFAQSRAAGRVLGPDSSTIAGVRVVLHQVGQTQQGPLDSINTDRNGRFRLVFRADTSALYLLSARHAGIEYFSLPLHTDRERPDTAIRIVVYDTSSTAPISVEARHLVVSRPSEDGSRSVLDLIVLRNDGQQTRISSDSLRPSWSGVLPAGTIGLDLGESDVSPEAVARRGDSLIVTAPLAPGDKQVTIQYLVPAGSELLELPFTETVPMINVLTEEIDAVVSGGTLALADSQVLQGRSFRRWTGSVPAGSSLRVALPGRARVPHWLLAALVAAVALALTGAGWYVLKQPSRTAAMSSDELLNAVAILDARYLGRETLTPADEWNTYRAERARLKELLEVSLAAKGRNR